MAVTALPKGVLAVLWGVGLVLPIPAPCAVYYLSSSLGDDRNDGLSPERPWRSLDRIFVKAYSSSPFAPGDRILLRRGDVFDGQIRFRGAGTREAPILIGAYGDGPKPVIYGDNPTIQWESVPDHPGVYTAFLGEGSIVASRAWQGQTPLRYTAPSGLNLSRPADLEKFLSSLPPGSFGPPSGNRVWVRTLDGGWPADVKIFRSAVVAIGASQHVIVENLDIRRANTAIDVSESDSVIVRSNDIQDTLGIAIYLRWRNTNCLIENNTVLRAGNTALYVLTGEGNTLRSNWVAHVTDTILGYRVGGDQAGLGLQESRNNLIEHNYLLFGGAFDYYFEQGTVIRYNYVYRTRGGGSPHGTRLRVYGNIFNINWQPGDPFGNGTNAVSTGAGTVAVYNNIFWRTNAYALMGSAREGQVIFRNNIVAGGRGRRVSFAEGVSSDYNCFFADAGPVFRYGQTDYKSLEDYSKATGQDVHSLYGDPRFVAADPIGPWDFRLLPTSPCIDAGTDPAAEDLEHPGYDFAGVPVPQGLAFDIGAFEWTPDSAYPSRDLPCVRVNAGGPALSGENGVSWIEDAWYSGGATHQVEFPIQGTPEPEVYRTERFGPISYRIPVPNGTYLLRLKFAEIHFEEPGQRVFHVVVNGRRVLEDFDIVREAGGPRVALDKTVLVRVTRGLVEIKFEPVIEQPKISGIEILPFDVRSDAEMVLPL